MSQSNRFELDQWLKQKSQRNRCHRFKQLEFDFGPGFEPQSSFRNTILNKRSRGGK